VLDLSVQLSEARVRADEVFLRELLEPVLHRRWELLKDRPRFGAPASWTLSRKDLKVSVKIVGNVIKLDHTAVKTMRDIIRHLERKERS
jgi:hypothetical protein